MQYEDEDLLVLAVEVAKLSPMLEVLPTVEPALEKKVEPSLEPAVEPMPAIAPRGSSV